MFRTLSAFFSTSLLILAACTQAQAPSISVTETVTVDAPAAEVWDVVKDFNALDRWHPAVATTEILEGENNQPGAVRLLTLGDGGTINEELKAWDDAGMSFTYVILEGVLPVSDYESTVSVEAVSNNRSKVTWTGDFNPGGDADEQTAEDTISTVYRAGLDNLKKMMSE